MDPNLLERVLDISRRMAETRQLTPLLNYAMEQAMNLVGAEYGCLVLVRADGTLDFRVMRNLENTETENAADQVSTSILNQVIQSRQPLIVQDAGTDPDWRKAKSVVDLKIRSVMCAPLIARGEAIGALYVENRSFTHRFRDADLTPLLFFANQAAVSIENATLNEDLEARVAERTHELEAALTQLEQGWMEAVEANRVRTMLLGNVAHDLRSPLAIVIESLNLLLEGVFGDLNEEQRDWISKSLEATNFVLNLTNDVFDLTKLEMGGLALYRQETRLHEFLKKIYNIGMGLPWPANVKVLLDIPDELPTLFIDPVRISQVLINLLSNAMKFTNEGSVTLYAQSLPDEDSVLIGVADTGDGIPPEKMDQLFQRFNQIDRNRERRRLGSGLGLAISRELIEMHGGRIWAESKPQAGSDFKFVLPIKTPEGNTPPVSERAEA